MIINWFFCQSSCHLTKASNCDNILCHIFHSALCFQENKNPFCKGINLSTHSNSIAIPSCNKYCFGDREIIMWKPIRLASSGLVLVFENQYTAYYNSYKLCKKKFIALDNVNHLPRLTYPFSLSFQIALPYFGMLIFVPKPYFLKSCSPNMLVLLFLPINHFQLLINK